VFPLPGALVSPFGCGGSRAQDVGNRLQPPERTPARSEGRWLRDAAIPRRVVPSLRNC